MTFVTTLDIAGLTPAEYRAVMDELGVERQPEPGIYLHLTTPIPDGFRLIEIWDRQEGFEQFAERRLTPATRAIGVDRPTAIAVVMETPAAARRHGVRIDTLRTSRCWPRFRSRIGMRTRTGFDTQSTAHRPP